MSPSRSSGCGSSLAKPLQGRVIVIIGVIVVIMIVIALILIIIISDWSRSGSKRQDR